MTSTNSNSRLTDAELIEHYKEHRVLLSAATLGGDVQKVIESAGYKGYPAYESMLLRAVGKHPLPITKDQDGDEWRAAITNLCALVPLEIVFQEIANSDYEKAKATETVLENIRSSAYESLIKSIKYEKAFAHMALRRYTYAFFAAQIDGLYTEERFDSIYNGSFLSFISESVSQSVTDEEIESDILIIDKLRPYLVLASQIFTNYLVNLLGKEQIETMPEDNEYFVQWKSMHNELENDGYYDELFVIRDQVIHAFIALEGSMVMDEEARAAFHAKAWNLFGKYDSKGRATY